MALNKLSSMADLQTWTPAKCRDEVAKRRTLQFKLNGQLYKGIVADQIQAIQARIRELTTPYRQTQNRLSVPNLRFALKDKGTQEVTLLSSKEIISTDPDGQERPYATWMVLYKGNIYRMGMVMRLSWYKSEFTRWDKLDLGTHKLKAWTCVTANRKWEFILVLPEGETP